MLLSEKITGLGSLVRPASEFPNPGIYFDVPESVYHADKTSISNSGLTEFNRSPQHFLHWREHGSTETVFDVFGKALHCYVLEQPVFFNRYAVKEKVDGRTNAGKLYNSEFETKNFGKSVINVEEFKKLQNMGESLNSNAYFSKLFRNGWSEVTAVWIDPDTGVKCRGRLDWVRDDGIIFDLKGIDGCSPIEMKRKAFSYRYNFQSVFYSDGFSLASGQKVETYICGTIEKTEPHEVAFYAFADQSIDDTRIRYKKLLGELKTCVENDIFPGYPQELITLESPRWLQYE